MSRDNIHLVEQRAFSICEEFCKYVIMDEFNSSILVNIEQEYYHELTNRLAWLGYVEIFKASIYPEITVTCTFLRSEIE